MRLTAIGLVLLLGTPVACDQHKPAKKTDQGEGPKEPAFVPKGAKDDSPGSGGGKSADKSSLDEYELVADLGFRPKPHGFSFPNFRLNDPDAIHLGPKDLKRMCGEKAVCASNSDEDECTLKAGAAAFLNSAGRLLGGGHCEGFSVGSLRLWAKEDDIDKLGSDKVFDLDRRKKTERYLAYWAVTQMSPSVAHATYRAAPNKILDRLIKTMKKKSESFVLGIHRADGKGGHAIVPYAVADMGDDVYRVFVYENNSPGKLRYVEFNKAENTWKYEDAATMTDEDSSTYMGSASTPRIELIPQSARKDMTCPFAKGSSSSSSDDDAEDEEEKPKPKKKKKVVEEEEPVQDDSDGDDDTMLIGRGSASLTVTDEAGHVTGIKNGEVVNEIPGATYSIPRGKVAGEMGPILYVPAATKVKLTVRGKEGQTDDVSIIGKKFAATLTAMPLSNTASQPIEIDASKKQLSFVGGAPAAQKIELFLDKGKTVQKLEVPTKVEGITSTGKLKLDGIKGKIDIVDAKGTSLKPIAAPLIPVVKVVATPKLIEPVKPVAPVAPVKPVAPVEPVKPGPAVVKPVAPVEPVKPGPVKPVEPVKPVTPTTPVAPVAPGKKLGTIGPKP